MNAYVTETKLGYSDNINKVSYVKYPHSTYEDNGKKLPITETKAGFQYTRVEQGHIHISSPSTKSAQTTTSFKFTSTLLLQAKFNSTGTACLY